MHSRLQKFKTAWNFSHFIEYLEYVESSRIFRSTTMEQQKFIQGKQRDPYKTQKLIIYYTTALNSIT